MMQAQAMRLNPYLRRDRLKMKIWYEGYFECNQVRQREIDEMLSTIREMVELKDLSEKPLEDEDNGLYGLADAVDYRRRKEAAWKKMRELAKMNNQKPSEP